MKKALIVKSSPMKESSVSNSLCDYSVELIKKKNPNCQIKIIDLSKEEYPHLTIETLSAFQEKTESQNETQKSLVKRSDEAVKELIEADLVIIASPMWNFGVPSSLKAYIDHICRAGLTFKYTETGPVGLLDLNKKAILICSRGGIYVESSVDHQERYLRDVFSFLGLKNINSIIAEGVAYGEESAKLAISTAKEKLDNLL